MKIMRARLEEYGLPHDKIELLLKGKEVRVFYGLLKLDVKKRELLTIYQATKERKVEKI